MKSSDNLPFRLNPAELQKPLGSWLLPEVNGLHTVGFHTKAAKPKAAQITVVDEEIVAEKVTLSELEAIRERAYEEGFKAGEIAGNESGLQAGDKRGYDEGLERGKAETDKQLAKLEALLQSLDQPLHQQHDQIALLVTELSTHIAEVVTKQLASEYKNIVQASVSEAIDQLPKQSGELLITVNPDDVSALAALAEKHSGRWQLLEDAELSVGGCMISTDTSVVDYCIESRFSDVVGQLKSRLDLRHGLALDVSLADDPLTADDKLLNSEKGDESV